MFAKKVPTSISKSYALPHGWEKCYTPWSEPYFVDHRNKRTQWQDPRAEVSIILNSNLFILYSFHLLQIWFGKIGDDWKKLYDAKNEAFFENASKQIPYQKLDPRAFDAQRSINDCFKWLALGSKVIADDEVSLVKL